MEHLSHCSQTKTLTCHPSPKTHHTKMLPELKSLSGGGEKVTRPKPALALVSGAARVGWVPATECGAGQTVTHREVVRARHFLRVASSHTNPSPLTPRACSRAAGSPTARVPHQHRGVSDAARHSRDPSPAASRSSSVA